jgi:hypothetical protein
MSNILNQEYLRFQDRTLVSLGFSKVKNAWTTCQHPQTISQNVEEYIYGLRMIYSFSQAFWPKAFGLVLGGGVWYFGNAPFPRGYPTQEMPNLSEP